MTESYVRLNGSVGTFILGPDIAALGGAAKLRVEVDAAIDAGTSGMLVGQEGDTTTKAFWFQVSSMLQFVVTPDGTASYPYPLNFSGVPGTKYNFGVVWEATSQVQQGQSAAQFMIGGTPLGPPILRPGMAGMFNSPGPVRIGISYGDSQRLTGNIYGLRIWANDVLVASPVFTDLAAAQTEVVDAQGNTWILQGQAVVVNGSVPPGEIPPPEPPVTGDDDLSWWPVEHGEMPAFQVKRPSYGSSRGGDFVRGSTDTWVLTADIITVEVAEVGIATITTATPHGMTAGHVIDVTDLAAAAAFNGRFTVLSAPTDTTLTYALSEGFAPTAPVASAGLVTTVPVKLLSAALKYQTDDTERRSAVAGQALLYVQPAGYDSVRIEWDWPVEDGQLQNWGEVALVRSMFGVPTTPNDGQTIFRSPRSAWADTDGKLMVGPVIYDEDLSGGFWYYYSLFFNISPHAPDLGDWVVGYSDWAQVPRHFQHDEHLFNGVPPYYQWIDENNKRKDGKGFLKQFLDIFGFELDFTRQSVEFMQDMYHTDISPIPLLRELGKNLGAVEEQGLGDIRFRAMMSDLAQRLNIRGTQKGLQQTIETMSKYDTDITTGRNMMLLPDDSAPFFSTGNWAGPHPDLVPLLDPVVTWDQTSLIVHPPDSEIPGVGSTGYLRISSPVAGDVLLTCGCGWIDPPVLTHPEGTRNQPGEYIPLTNGVPVEETGVYGFAAYLRNSVTSTEPTLSMLWFDGSGEPEGLLYITEGIPPAGGTTLEWEARHVVQDVAPEGAVYLVPAVHITARPDTNAYVDMTGAMVYILQQPGSGFTVTPPDQLLTLGDPNEKIGGPPDPNDPTFTGYVIGAPAQKNSRMIEP